MQQPADLMVPSSTSRYTSLIAVPVALSLLVWPTLLRYRGFHPSSPNPLTDPHTLLLHFDAALPGLLPTIASSILAYYATKLAVGACRSTFAQRGFKGRDLLKPGIKDEVPESLGLPASCVYLLALFSFIPFRYYLGSLGSLDNGISSHPTTPKTTKDGGWVGDMSGRTGFPHHELATYLSALLSLLSSLILGFCDDVFDIRWRFKMPIPIVSSIPMLLVYYAGQGGTGLVVPGWPIWLRQTVGKSVIDLGVLYYVYMALLSVFCTHSINILAGINGVEVGQALIISLSLCINDGLYLPFKAALAPAAPSPTIKILPWMSSIQIQDELVSRHLFSLSLMLPLAATCAGLLAWNRHPSLVFVGDTFCYFAGQALACAGVLGHFSKTLLLFFIPQIFNFLLSCPQLFGFVPCPRHRVPKVHPETMGLYPSIAVFPAEKPIGKLGSIMLIILETLGFVVLWRQADLDRQGDAVVPKEQANGKEKLESSHAHSGQIRATTNLTLLNTLLVISRVQTPIEHVRAALDTTDASSSPSNVPSAIPRPRGPHITEPKLWKLTMAVQLLGSAIAFGIRYWAAAVVFPEQ